MTEKRSAKIVRIKCCAFCGLTQWQVSLLIQGPAIGFESPVHICAACVEVCAQVVLEEKQRTGTVERQEQAVAPSASAAPSEQET